MKFGISALATLVLVALPLLAPAQMGGMGGATAGSGMGSVILADDGSLLLYTMTASPMGGGTPAPAVMDLFPGGGQRWETSFGSQWPMMPVTKGTLVLVPLFSLSWTGMGGTRASSNLVTLTALNLANGQQVWSKSFSGDMIGGTKFSADGTKIYLTIQDMSSSGMGSAPMGQGDASGMGGMASSTVVALDTGGNTLWTYVQNGSGMGASSKVKP